MARGFDVAHSFQIGADDMTAEAAEYHKTLKKGSFKPLTLKKVCAACCSLRKHIRFFEESHFLNTGKLPTSEERGDIATVDTQYKDLKAGARGYAITKIQALARGRRARNVVWGAAGKDRDARASDVVIKIRRELEAGPSANEEMRRFERKRIAGGNLAALVERMNAERTLANRTFPGLDSTAKDLHAEKNMVKSVLKAHTRALSESLKREPSALDLEDVKPAFVLYHIVNARLKELEAVGAETESRRAKQEALKEKFHDLREEAKRLKTILGKYEEAFTAKHGRKMKTKVELEPIATEYARFKEVKVELQALQDEYAALCQ